MRITTNLQHGSLPFDVSQRPFGRERQYVVGIDCEWTKNYKVKNGNRFFCYSLSFVEVPNERIPLGHTLNRVGIRSVYAESQEELPVLAMLFDQDVAALLSTRCIVAGHQLCSDLSVVLACASTVPLAAVRKLQGLWRSRATADPVSVFDSRFDMGECLEGLESRRLVDVCNHLGLDVTQPELSQSMTRMHSRFLDGGSDLLYEKLAVLNIRHGLSAAVLALLHLGKVDSEPVSINKCIHDHLWDIVDYVASEDFATLLT
jgi:hypothetical protein